jgi:hypothetical protein
MGQGISTTAHLTRWVWNWGVNLTQIFFPSLAFWAERAWALRWSTKMNQQCQKILRISNTERSAFSVSAFFFSSFFPRGKKCGGGVDPAPLAKESMASIVVVTVLGGVGWEMGVPVKT